MTEKELSEKVGVAVAELRLKRRELTQGVHFGQAPGKAVTYSEAGIAAVLETYGLKKTAIGGQEATTPAPGQKNAATVATAVTGEEILQARVCRVYPNKHWVAAEVGKVIGRVRVLNNGGMRRGQLIQVVHEEADRYAMVLRNGRPVR